MIARVVVVWMVGGAVAWSIGRGLSDAIGGATEMLWAAVVR